MLLELALLFPMQTALPAAQEIWHEAQAHFREHQSIEFEMEVVIELQRDKEWLKTSSTEGSFAVSLLGPLQFQLKQTSYPPTGAQEDFRLYGGGDAKRMWMANPETRICTFLPFSPANMCSLLGHFAILEKWFAFSATQPIDSITRKRTASETIELILKRGHTTETYTFDKEGHLLEVTRTLLEGKLRTTVRLFEFQLFELPQLRNKAISPPKDFTWLGEPQP